jgi:hypothetical protein
METCKTTVVYLNAPLTVTYRRSKNDRLSVVSARYSDGSPFPHLDKPSIRRGVSKEIRRMLKNSGCM